MIFVKIFCFIACMIIGARMLLILFDLTTTISAIIFVWIIERLNKMMFKIWGM